MNLLVGNIQRFCLHDGPGIRTTVFLMGCDLSCPWCANPENQKREKIEAMGRNSLPYGRWYSPEMLIEECKKDRPFYGKNGGVTFSGGEPLLWADELIPVLDGLKTSGVSICTETSLYTNVEAVQKTWGKIDEYYVDLKTLCSEKYAEFLGGSIDTFFVNLEYLESRKSKIVYRIPVVESFNFDSESRASYIAFFKARPGSQVELFACHDLANAKYGVMRMPVFNIGKVNRAELDCFINELELLDVRIGELAV
ncbi:MAG: radical SAM protein [Fibrobacterota bacterium]|nr:radical SAM protein [Fibrobacterota bacterium]QQS06344.1 MAG: radical SAM protein [Fibrobacterota bacterium]